MPLRIQSPKTLLHNYREKQAAKKGRHKQHDVGVSDTSPGMMESSSGTERLEQTPVGNRQTEKHVIKRPILQMTTRGDGQDQELLDELMPRHRPAGAPPTYDEATMHPGEVDIPSSPPPAYRQEGFHFSPDDLKKQTKVAISAYVKADKALKAQQKKVESLEQELAEKVRKKGTDKAGKLREKLQTAKTKLSEEESVCEQLEKTRSDLEKALDDATSLEVDEGSQKHKSKLATMIKPWLTFNKEELAGLRTRKDAVSKELNNAKKLKNKKDKAHNDLIEALKKEIRTANKASNGMTGRGGAEALHQKMLDAQKELDEAKAQLQIHQQLMAEVESEITESAKNSDSLVDFAVSFATNLRKLHKLQEKDNAVARANMARLQSFTAPKLVIDTPDGKVQVENLKIKLKSLEFKQNAAKQWVPVLGIESMSGRISVPMPDQQAMVIALDIKDVTVDLDAGFGNPLHSYVTSRFGITGAAKALFSLPKALSALMPRHIKARGQKVGVTLDDFSPATIAAAAHKGQSTPDSAPDQLFEALGFGIDAALEDISVQTRGKVELQGSAKGAVIQYSPDPLKKGDTSTSRKVVVKADHGALTVSDGLPVVESLLKELEIKDPLSLIPELSKKQDSVSMGKLRNLSQKLHVVVSKPDIELTRELEKKVVSKSWGGLRKKRSWTLSGSNKVRASIGSLDISNAGDIRAKAKVKDLRLQAEPTGNGGNKLEAGASSVKLDVDSPTKLLSPDGLLVKSGLMKGGVDITGKARLSLDGPKFKGEFSDSEQAVTLQLPTLEVTAEEKVELSTGQLMKGQHGVTLPKGLNLTAHGEVKLHAKDDITTVTPQLRLHANDRKGTVFVKANGKTLPVDLKAEVVLHKAPYRALSYTDETTGKKVTTPVITEGGLTINSPQVGPLKMSNLSLTLDKRGNGKLRANDIEVNLASLAAGDRVDFTNHPDEEPSVIIQDDPVPWYAKPLLANKRLHLCAETGIKRGQVNLKNLRAFKLKFTNTRDAGPLDRVVTAVLNLGSGFIARRLQKCEISHQTLETTDPNTRGATVRKPCITLKVWPIKRTYPLDIPAHIVDPKKDTISAVHALHENTGLIVVRQQDFDAILDGINQIKLGKSVGITYLDDLCRSLSQTHEGTEAIHLMGEQFPVEHARQVLAGCSPRKRTQIVRQLNSCADVFVNHPRLQNQAIKIFQLTGYEPPLGLFKQMEADVLKNSSADPTGLAILMQPRDSAKARELFELALSRGLSVAVAHTRMGCETLKKASPISKTPNGAQQARIAMGHLMRGALEGNTEAKEVIARSEKSTDPVEISEAKLAHAALFLKQEKSRDDFYAAVERLEFLALQSSGNKTKHLAEELLSNRKKNASQIFHTENEEAFEKTQESVKQLRDDVFMKRPLPTGKKAYSLGVKLLYAADGALRDVNLAIKLLNRAPDIPAARVHLKVAENKV